MTTAKRKRSGTRDPRGGLTAAGRAAFRRKQGSHLKPGVENAAANMSAEEMRRKGSWAVRFYGRSGKLPPLATLGGSSRRRNTSECFKRCSWEATRYLFAGQPQSIIDDSRTILAQAILNAAQSGRAETNALRHEGIRALTVAYPRIAI